MTEYVIDFQGYVPEWGQINLTADDLEQARDFALDQINDVYPEMDNIEITRIEEFN